MSNYQLALEQRIEAALEQRELLAPALAAFADELPKGRTRRELFGLAESLRSDVTAKKLIASNAQVTRWLPLLARGGGSQRMLTDLLEEASRENEGRTQWLRVLLYPAIILAIAFAVLLTICIAVAPIFTELFDDFGLRLPASTQTVVGLSNAILGNPREVLLVVASVVLGIYVAYRLLGIWSLPRRVWNAFTRGSSRQVTAMASFTRRLADALDAGLAVPDALRLAGHTEPRRPLQQIALQLASEAEQPSFTWQDSRIAWELPPTVVYALHAAAGDAPSIPLLRQLSESYVSRVHNRSDWTTGFVSQLAIIAVGLVVGFVVIALFSPLVSLVNNLSG